jgi:hypothetical protein
MTRKRAGKRNRPKISKMSNSELGLTSYRDKGYLTKVLPVFLGDAGSPNLFCSKHPIVLHIGTQSTPSIQVTDCAEFGPWEQSVCTAFEDLHVSTQDVVQAQWEKLAPRFVCRNEDINTLHD